MFALSLVELQFSLIPCCSDFSLDSFQIKIKSNQINNIDNIKVLVIPNLVVKANE